MEYPNRKHVRLKNYDYSQNGCYFITLCAKDRQRILCNIVGRAESSRPTTISQIIGVLKRLINKEFGKNFFQTSFNDHIIRDEYDYITRWNYIEKNPIKWAEKAGEHQ